MLVVGVLVAGLVSSSAWAKGAPARTEIMPLRDIKPHMKGYAVTVFSGTEPDRFDIEIIDIVPDFLTGMDVILFRALDPRLVHSGIVAGMSGSPVYINDKMIGAVAYGYAFNKDPTGGITPIEAMLEVNDLPYRPDVQIRSKAWKSKGMAVWNNAWLDPLQDPLLAKAPSSAGRQVPAAPFGQDLMPLGHTLSLSGFAPSSRQFLGQALEMTPVQGGSGKSGHLHSSTPRKKEFAPGDSMSVVLIAGDNAAASNGTVTWVGGKQKQRSLAFGHPMQGVGASEMPVANAHVHTIISSVQRSFKLASPLDIQGTMVQDRQPAIAVRTDIRAPMIPVTTSVQGPEAKLKTRRFENAVAVHPELTPALVTSILLSAISEAAGDATELVVHTKHKLSYSSKAGRQNATIDERTFFPNGVNGRVLSRSRALGALSAILYNPFELGKIHRVVQEVRVDYGSPVERIEAVTVLSDKVRAGERLSLLVRLKSLRGQRTRSLPVQVQIPSRLAGQRVAVQVAGGDWVRPYVPMASGVDDLVRSLATSFPERSLVVTIYTEQEGLSLPGGMLDRLPPSILSTLSSPATTQEKVRFKHAARRVLIQPSFIAGSHDFQIDVDSPRVDRTPVSYLPPPRSP